MLPEKYICKSCYWFADFEGVCCCADSEYVADCPPMFKKECETFKAREGINSESLGF